MTSESDSRPAAPPSDERSRRGWRFWLALVGPVLVVIAVALAVWAVQKNRVRPSSAATPVVSSTALFHEVRYEADGDVAVAEVTLATADGGVGVPTRVRLPLTDAAGAVGVRRTLTTGSLASLVVRPVEASANSKVTCRIRVDGVVVVERSATGVAAVANCSRII
ncbi:MAG: hypothetical protein EPO13_08565 [Actinomycetota bacterium]|nr:MAG: hypothetical protein EPO13_08565 [Actinomycetota bacterium]